MGRANVVRLPIDRTGRRSESGTSSERESSDGELVRAARSGDEGALEALCRRHLGSVRGLVLRLLPADGEADDLVQEAFVLALDDLDKLRDDDSFGAWVRGVAANLVRSRLRRRSWLRGLGLWSSAAEALEVQIASNAPPDVVAELSAVYRAVGRLSADARTVLVLHKVEEMTLSEVSAMLRISLSTAKRRLATGLAELEYELTRRAKVS